MVCQVQTRRGKVLPPPSCEIPTLFSKSLPTILAPIFLISSKKPSVRGSLPQPTSPCSLPTTAPTPSLAPLLVGSLPLSLGVPPGSPGCSPVSLVVVPSPLSAEVSSSGSPGVVLGPGADLGIQLLLDATRKNFSTVPLSDIPPSVSEGKMSVFPVVLAPPPPPSPVHACPSPSSSLALSSPLLRPSVPAGPRPWPESPPGERKLDFSPNFYFKGSSRGLLPRYSSSDDPPLLSSAIPAPSTVSARKAILQVSRLSSDVSPVSLSGPASLPSPPPPPAPAPHPSSITILLGYLCFTEKKRLFLTNHRGISP